MNVNKWMPKDQDKIIVVKYDLPGRVVEINHTYQRPYRVFAARETEPGRYTLFSGCVSIEEIKPLFDSEG